MLYQINRGTVSLGGKEILKQLDFAIRGREKAAIVGKNGAGKTTFLRLLAGELELDADDSRMEPGICTSRKLTVAMLHQDQSLLADRTVEELFQEYCPEGEAFSRERFSYETEFDRMFTGFGLKPEEKKKRISDFSGGEQTKIALIRLLLEKPDILLLDEPTNHLDIPAVEWLETYMKTYDRAVVIVSHDRFFLDQVVDVVWELQNGRLTRYPGNYTHYREQKQKDLALAKKAYARQQEEISRMEELIRRFKNKPRKAAFARSRKKLLERMKPVPRPEADEVHIFTGDLEPLVRGGKWAVETEHLQIGYQEPLLELSLRVRRGQKIGIIGKNGAGKSAFLKTVAGELPLLKGKCILGNHTTAGYFDQQTAAISTEKTVYEHFHEQFPVLTEKEVRQTLGTYLFGGKMASVRVDSLSGGEKSRLMLAELLSSRPNLLLLDEPTNHMDVQAKETLESAFQSYRGTILFVSHDRYFIRQVADAILVFENGKAFYYPFGYEHYLRHSRSLEDGEELKALLKTEDQALVEGFRAVPKKEKRYIKEMSPDEAYLDWQLRLAREQMTESAAAAERLDQAYQEFTLEADCAQEASGSLDRTVWLTDPERFQKSWMEKRALVKKDRDEAWEDWTQKCLAWYDIWKEIPKYPKEGAGDVR